MENALAIANQFIQLGVSLGIPPTQMKLQKLLYFAHGWYLALYDEPLVDEGFEAWKYGPVIPSVYYEFRDFGVNGIDREGTIPAITADNKISYLAPVINDNNYSKVARLVRKIQEVYGKYNGTQLSRLTHLPDTPWTKAREGHDEDELSIPISNESIKNYFKKKLDD